MNPGNTHQSPPEVLKRVGPQIAATDRQIDRLVHELYDLTDDEIRIVDEATT